LAGGGQTVGLTALGTALTDRQADLLGPYILLHGPGILVATDNDAAGQQAAERAFWQLTTRGDDPRRLALLDGLDPADLFHREGATRLRTAIDTASSLADNLLDARLTAALSDRSPAALRAALRDVSATIVALPPSRWLAHVDRGNRGPRPAAWHRPRGRTRHRTDHRGTDHDHDWSTTGVPLDDSIREFSPDGSHGTAVPRHPA
jgi:hypothetical protein